MIYFFARLRFSNSWSSLNPDAAGLIFCKGCNDFADLFISSKEFMKGKVIAAGFRQNAAAGSIAVSSAAHILHQLREKSFQRFGMLSVGIPDRLDVHFSCYLLNPLSQPFPEPAFLPAAFS